MTETLIRIIRLISLYGYRGVLIYFQLRKGRSALVKLPGIKYSINIRGGTSDLAIFNQIFVNKEYEIDLSYKPEFIIDAGANIGLSAVYFANRFPEASIIAIEPEKANFDSLQQNTGDYPRIYCLKLALSNTPGKIVKIMDDGNSESGYMTQDSDEPVGKIVDEAETTTIDQLMDQYRLSYIDLLKIDIEGSEKELFSSNYESWLPKTRCLVVETHDRMKLGCSKSLFDALQHYNFSCTPHGENLVFTNNNL